MTLPADIPINGAAIAFLLGVLLAAGIGRVITQRRVAKRDPRDEQIRSLQAELRVARSEVERLKGEAEQHRLSLEDTTLNLRAQTSVVAGQKTEIDRLAYDLKSSVKKTRELRAELADRATQNVYAEAKIREVETELSVAQASAEMLATGVFGEDVFADDESDDIVEAHPAKAVR
ncbi:MAG: hypothetical protein WBM87_13320 [Woeseiaceae bacterium]